ncbi:MAG: hypothetical protein FJ087_19180 [Deltaproteobacteria bacterium]|nr:hypothetical protein [Deltaproteobacteria bacterium]
MERAAFTSVLAVALAAAAPSGARADGVPSVADQVAMMYQALQDTVDASLAPDPILDATLLARATPDECFYGVGDPRNHYEPDVALPCPDGSVPKVNQAYVWGLARAGTDLWLGTGANVNCLVAGGLAYLSGGGSTVTPSHVCEVEKSAFGGKTGDWRPPRVFVYPDGGPLSERTGAVDAAGRALLDDTLGLRSAGAKDGVVLLGGPSRGQDAVHLFAFRAADGAFLGSHRFEEYRNIRKWLTIGDTLYTGVGAKDGGRVIRWRGSQAAPFAVEVVGTIDGEAAELAFHEGRLFVSTWPAVGGDVAQGTTPSLASLKPTGLWMSPPVPAGGLTAADAGAYRKVWQSDAYEPDPIVALAYGGGGIASYGGWLYWGTLHIPGAGYAAHLMALAFVTGLPLEEVRGGSDQQVLDVLGTWRATALFRGRGFDGAAPEVELLYGESSLPAADRASRVWEMAPNAMGRAPRFGHSGFGNPYNAYTWTMGEFAGSLWVGTFDMGFLVSPDDGSGTIPGLPILPNGADLYRFPSADLPAKAESLDGLGNKATYGIRTMVAGDAFYLGTANPMNLLADPAKPGPKGGWELLRLVPKAAPPGPVPDAAGGDAWDVAEDAARDPDAEALPEAAVGDAAPAAGSGGGCGAATQPCCGAAAWAVALLAAALSLARRRERGGA